jgi:hypothetical protein
VVSGTRKTNPVFARLRSRDLKPIEHHMCAQLGKPCDLPAQPPHNSERWTRCTWEPDYGRIPNLWGRSRGEQFEARRDRRKARRRGRRSIAEGVGDFVEGVVDDLL